MTWNRVDFLEEIKTRKNCGEQIIKLADRYDGAILGIADKLLVYNRDGVINVLVGVDGMPRKDAVEFFENKIAGSYSFEGPLFIEVVL